MFISILIFLIIIVSLVFSIRQRLINRKLRMRSWDGSETKSSPLSEALSGLIGTAGGIYLSLAMLISFMELNIPNQVNFFDVALEPLAAISFSLAVIQPFAYHIFQLRKKI